jgi:Fe-S cluster assembly protein SufB
MNPADLEATIREMSSTKGEPDWMLDFRLESHRAFRELPMPGGHGDLSGISLDGVVSSIEPTGRRAESHLADALVPDEAEEAFHRSRADLERRGVLFTDMDTALWRHPEIVMRYLGTIIPPGDTKFSALNSAVWSGGSFIYVPPGVEVEVPLQTSSRVVAAGRSPFERTLIVADEGSTVHHIDGCSAPVYTSHALRSAVVEIVVKPGAHVTHTTIQNWSSNVVNLVTKRAWVEEAGHMAWIDGNIGGRRTVGCPSVYLAGPKASGEALSVAHAGRHQHQDTGAEMVHMAPETTSKILSRAICRDGGRSSYRSLVEIEADAHGCTSHVQCDALTLDSASVSDTHPSMEIGSADAQVEHETSVSNVPDEQLFYLMSRGLAEEQAIGMIVNGFIEPVTCNLPTEYAVEWSRLIALQMEGSVG